MLWWCSLSTVACSSALIFSHLCYNSSLPVLISPEIVQSLCYKLPGRFLFSLHKCLCFRHWKSTPSPLVSDLCYWYFTGCLGCKQRCSKPLTHPLPRCAGSETGVWSSTVNHRSDFAYLEGAVTCANITTLCLSLSSPLPAPPPSPSYLSIIKVGIDPFTTLPLSGCSHKAQTCLPSLNQWHLPALLALFPHVSFAFLALALKPDRLKFCTSQFGLFGFFRKYEKWQTEINLSWHKQV